MSVVLDPPADPYLKRLVLGNLMGAEPADVYVDMPIKVAYQDISGEDLTMWRWVPR